MMNSFERVTTALRREQPDRVPIFCFCDDASTASNTSGFLSEATSARFKTFIRAKADMFYTRILYTGFMGTGLEPVCTSIDLDDGWSQTTYRFGNNTEFTAVSKRGKNANYIGYRKCVIASPADIQLLLGLGYLPPQDNPRLAAWIDEINTFGKTNCADGAFFRIAFLGPLGTLGDIMDQASFALLSVEDEPLLRRFLEVTLQRQAEYLEYVLARIQAPAIVNIAGAEFAIPPLMAPRSFAQYVTPYDGKLIEITHRHGLLHYYHSHGKVRNFLTSFAAMQVDGLHPLEPVGATGDCELAEVKQQFGRNLCIVGNIQYDDLVRLSSKQIDTLVQQTMEAAKAGGGLILSPSCTPYHNPMSTQVEENMIAFIEAGLRYGKY
jgi:hypothetical protein